MFGLSLPPLEAVIGVGAGFVVPPMIAGYVAKMVPASWQGPYTSLLVKGVSAFVPAAIVRRFINVRWGNYMLIGGGVYFAMELIKQFLPGVIPGLGFQPMLGSYFNSPTTGLPFGRPRVGLPPILSGTPDRLSPDNRF